MAAHNSTFFRHGLRFAAAVFWIQTQLVHAAVIEEYITPSADSSPAGLAFDADGILWFTMINAGKIGRLDPNKVKAGTSEGITEYDLPKKNSQPNAILVARNGTVWFSQMHGNRIGRLDPKSGSIKEYPIPTPGSEPHHLVEAEDGGIWFAQFETDKIARLDPATGAIREHPVNPGHPHDLVIDNGKIWYTQGGKFWAKVFFNKIASLDPATGAIEEIPVPPERSVPHAMAKAKDGGIWFTQFFANKITKLDFTDGAAKLVEYPLPGKRKGTHDLVVDDERNRIWVALNHANSIGLLDLAKARPGTSEGMQEFKIPTPKAHPNTLTLDAEGNVWFVETGRYFRGQFNNKIGKLTP